jgi:hypothetical protein
MAYHGESKNWDDEDNMNVEMVDIADLLTDN